MRKVTSHGHEYWLVETAAKSIICLNGFTEADALIFDEMYQANDRTLAIMGVAYLETRLKEILQAFFIKDDVSNTLLNPLGGALATFATMTDVIFVCGLMYGGDRDLLKAMAVIRNAFAHNPYVKDFVALETLAKKDKSLNKKIGILWDYAHEVYEDISVFVPTEPSINDPEPFPFITEPTTLRNAFEITLEEITKELRDVMDNAQTYSCNHRY
jgi:hypothetical protein